MCDIEIIDAEDIAAALDVGVVDKDEASLGQMAAFFGTDWLTRISEPGRLLSTKQSSTETVGGVLYYVGRSNAETIQVIYTCSGAVPGEGVAILLDVPEDDRQRHYEDLISSVVVDGFSGELAAAGLLNKVGA